MRIRGGFQEEVTLEPSPEGTLGLSTTEKKEKHSRQGNSLCRSSETLASCFYKWLPLLPLLQVKGPRGAWESSPDSPSVRRGSSQCPLPPDEEGMGQCGASTGDGTCTQCTAS